jgi:hypothetical protein
MQKAREARNESVARTADPTLTVVPSNRDPERPTEQSSETSEAAQPLNQTQPDNEVPPCCRSEQAHTPGDAAQAGILESERAEAVDEAIELLQAEGSQDIVHASMADWRVLLALGTAGLTYVASQHLTRTRARIARDPRDSKEFTREESELN